VISESGAYYTRLIRNGKQTKEKYSEADLKDWISAIKEKAKQSTE